MFRRNITLLVVPALLLLAAPAVAGASAGAKSHAVNLRGLIDTISSKGTTGTPGATETDSGIFAGTISGRSTRGAFYQYATFGSGLTLTGHGVAFDTGGSIRFKLSAKFAPAAGGTATYTGTFTATGGTGLYKNAHGTLGISGTTLTSDPDAATFKESGTLKY